jgi:GNAT superfamily N-acetyltransferase
MRPLLPDGYFAVPPGRVAAVVTVLERRTGPVGPPPSAPSGWALERVGRPDPDWYQRLFRRVGEDWMWYSRLRIDRARLQALIHDPATEVLVVRDGGAELGLVELNRREPPDVEIAYFALVPEARGRGGGRWLMHAALQRAFVTGPSRVWLHTCTLDHPAALGFYLRCGFTAIERRIEITPDPRLDGTVDPSVCPDLPIIRA